MCQECFYTGVYVGSSTLLLVSVTVLPVAGPGSTPASASGGALIGKRSFLPVDILKGWKNKQCLLPLQ